MRPEIDQQLGMGPAARESHVFCTPQAEEIEWARGITVSVVAGDEDQTAEG
jgi:hypothetical protein